MTIKKFAKNTRGIDEAKITVTITNTSKGKLERKKKFEEIMEKLKDNVIYRDENGEAVSAYCMAPLDLCEIDEEYQRKHKRIRKLVNGWNLRKLMPIIVVPDKKNYVFKVVDGGGRCVVAGEKGFSELFAVVIMDAPENPRERLRFEAEFFSTQNDETERLDRVDKHLSMVIKGDAAAVALDNACKKHDVDYTNMTNGPRRPKTLGSYGDTYRIASELGFEGLEFTFAIIENAGWDLEKNGYAAPIMRALSRQFEAHPEHISEIYRYLSTELRENTPGLFMAEARTKYPKREYRASCVLYTEDIVCKALGIERVINVNGNRISLRKGA